MANESSPLRLKILRILFTLYQALKHSSYFDLTLMENTKSAVMKKEKNQLLMHR